MSDPTEITIDRNGLAWRNGKVLGRKPWLLQDAAALAPIAEFDLLLLQSFLLAFHSSISFGSISKISILLS